MKKKMNGCLIMVIAIFLLAIAYLVWTFAMMA